MTHLYCRYLLTFIILSVLHIFSDPLQAQCPQRYKDRVFTQLKQTPNILYGDVKENFDGTRAFMAFDMYEPDNDTVSERPLIVMIHGGSFTNNPPLTRKSPEIKEIAKDLARRGYVVISPEYRLFSGELTYEKMATTIVAAFLDIHQMMCFLQDSYENGNPYKINPDFTFMGGSSAGALLPLNFNAFISDTSDIPAYLVPFFKKAADFDGIGIQEVLEQKYCGIRPKGILSISGAIIDTGYLKPTDISFLFIHGELDKALPYEQGHALGNTALPVVYGPGVYLDNMTRLGIRTVADIYPDAYHVPVLQPFGDSLMLALQNAVLTGNIFNEPVMDSTKRHIARFCYELMGSPLTSCTVTGLKPEIMTGQLSIYPNPSAGRFNIECPFDAYVQTGSLTVTDMSGRTVYEQQLPQPGNMIHLDISGQPGGMYILTIQWDGEENNRIYTDKLLIH